MKIRKVEFYWKEHFVFKVDETWRLGPSIEKWEWLNWSNENKEEFTKLKKGFTIPTFLEVKTMLSSLMKRYAYVWKSAEKVDMLWKQGLLLLSKDHYDVLWMWGKFPDNSHCEDAITPDLSLSYQSLYQLSKWELCADFYSIINNFRKDYSITEKTLFTKVPKWDCFAVLFLKVNPCTRIKSLNKEETRMLQSNWTNLNITKKDHHKYKDLIKKAIREIEEESYSYENDEIFKKITKEILHANNSSNLVLNAFCDYTKKNPEMFYGRFSISYLHWYSVWRDNELTGTTEDITESLLPFRYLRLNEDNIKSLLEIVLNYIWY